MRGVVRGACVDRPEQLQGGYVVYLDLRGGRSDKKS